MTRLFRFFSAALIAFLLISAASARAQVTVSSTIPFLNTFVTDGTNNNAGPNNDYGASGALMVAGANSANGTFDTLLQFSLASAYSQFNATYGMGNWTVTNVTLTLAGNFAVQGSQPSNAIFPTINGGDFGIDWVADNNWTTGPGTPTSPSTSGVTYDNLSSVIGSSDQTLGSYVYTPPGNNVQLTWSLGTASSGLVSEITSGTDVSLYLYPNDSTVGYLFNSASFGTAADRPQLTVTAVPEPSACASLITGLAGMAFFARRRRRC